MRDRTFLALALALLLILAALVPAVASAGTREQAMLGSINAARAARGLAPVKPYRPLRRASKRYAAYMIRHNTWAHAANPARGVHLQYVGEILGESTWDYPPGLVQAWLASPAHRPLILDARHRYVGIGVRHGVMDGASSWVWVVRFGAR